MSTKESNNIINNPASWEKVYIQTINPVISVESEITKCLLEYTTEGELLLEAGCGSGILSAELALSGRKVALCDFSQAILDRAKKLFEISSLESPQTFLFDITQQWPFRNEQFDVVWNSGVLEHWTDKELLPIITEMSRCSKRCVISIVPNERSVFYRLGRERAEKFGIAPWGREMPRKSLKHIFEICGLKQVIEKTICPSMALNFLNILDPVSFQIVNAWWDTLIENDPVKENQGYLLVTVGYKNI